MAKRLPDPYYPTAPPVEFNDWHRWIDEELNRIEQAIAANPIICAIEGSGVIPVEPTISTVRLGIGDLPLFDYPSGSWDPIVAEYAVGQAGIYGIKCEVFLAAFGTGNKNYLGLVEVFVNGSPRATMYAGGGDDVPLSVVINRDLLLVSGDQVWLELSTQHDQFTGSTNYNYSMSFIRSAVAG